MHLDRSIGQRDLDRFEMVFHFGAMGAGIVDRRAADRAGQAGTPFHAGPPPFGTVAPDPGKRRLSGHPHAHGLSEIGGGQQLLGAFAGGAGNDHQSADTAIPDQQIAAAADDGDGQSLTMRPAQRGDHLVGMTGAHGKIGGTADAPGGHIPHRGIHHDLEIGMFGNRCENGSRCGTAHDRDVRFQSIEPRSRARTRAGAAWVMSPAPMVSTTSPFCRRG